MGARRKLRGFVFRRYFFKRTNIHRSIAAEAVPFVAPKGTKRRTRVIRNASLPHRPLRAIRQNHGLQHSFPTDRSRWADASESAAMPLPPHRPPSFCLILAEAVLLTPQANASLSAF